MRGTVRTVAGAALMCALTAALAWLVLPAQLGGSTYYLSARGTSMEPDIRAGDLAVIRASGEYDVGDVLAYRSELLDAVVMHRVVAADGSTYSLRGDSNTFVDRDRPTDDDVLGRVLLQIPQGGTWLARATGPTGLGLLAFAFVGVGGAATTRRLRRRKGARHAYRSAPSVQSLSPVMLGAGVVTAAVGLLGVALGGVAWTVSPMETVTDAAPGREVTFSYRAQVPRSAAYDGTAVRSPAPVFRRLAQRVDVSYAYTGEPGRVTVTARLSATSGWRSVVRLAPATSFARGSHEGTVTLDLRDLDRRAARAAEVIGIPAGQLDVVVVPRFVTSSGAVFAPELALVLAPERLALGNGAKLTVADEVDEVVTSTPRTWRLLGTSVTVATARVVSVVVVAGAVLLLGLIYLHARRTWAACEADAINRRYAAMLLKVHPMTLTSGRPVVDVTDFATLAKLAERYGLLVLHWSRSGIETYLVQDEGATYRYRTGDGPARTVTPVARHV